MRPARVAAKRRTSQWKRPTPDALTRAASDLSRRPDARRVRSSLQSLDEAGRRARHPRVPERRQARGGACDARGAHGGDELAKRNERCALSGVAAAARESSRAVPSRREQRAAATSSRTPTGNNQRPNERPTANNQQPRANNHRPQSPTNSQQPTANNPQPTTDDDDKNNSSRAPRGRPR